MIIVLKVGYTEAELNEILEFLQVRGLKVNVSHGKTNVCYRCYR